MKKQHFFILLIFIIPSILFSGGWKISLNASFQLINLNDLEANKDFWNIALYRTVEHKRELGENIEIPEKIDRLKYSPAIGVSLEKDFKRFLFALNLNKFHSSYNPYFKMGDLPSSNYEVINNTKETLDVFSPSFSIGYKIIDNKTFFVSLNFATILNFFSFKYSQDFNWRVLDRTGTREIINISMENYTKITKLIPSFMPSINTGLKYKRLGLSFASGFNYGKVSGVSGNIDFSYSMHSAFHDPIEHSFSGNTNIWICEKWVELMGYDYWVRTHLYGEQKPQENPHLRNIKPLEINLSGFFLKISISYFF